MKLVSLWKKWFIFLYYNRSLPLHIIVQQPPTSICFFRRLSMEFILHVKTSNWSVTKQQFYHVSTAIAFFKFKPSLMHLTYLSNVLLLKRRVLLMPSHIFSSQEVAWQWPSSSEHRPSPTFWRTSQKRKGGSSKNRRRCPLVAARRVATWVSFNDRTAPE